jgi:uncharacterized membrane protein YgcG
MSAAIAAVGVALVVLLTIPAVLVLRRRGRVRNETPLERYRREVVDFRYTTQARTSPRTWRRRRNNAGWVAGITAAGAAGGLGAAGSDGGSTHGGCGGGGGGCGGGGGGGC